MSSIKYITHGDPARIPKIGTVVPLGPLTATQLQEHLYFRVEAYGEPLVIDWEGKKAYGIELLGSFITHKGSPSGGDL